MLKKATVCEGGFGAWSFRLGGKRASRFCEIPNPAPEPHRGDLGVQRCRVGCERAAGEISYD